MYLSTYTAGGRKPFVQLQDAKTACLKTADCGGITMEPYNRNDYTLRQGTGEHNLLI